jgi:hypothetical protein
MPPGLGTRSLKKWDDLGEAIKHVRRLDEVAFVAEGRGQNEATAAPSPPGAPFH